jgi:hypothetical protein
MSPNYAGTNLSDILEDSAWLAAIEKALIEDFFMHKL